MSEFTMDRLRENLEALKMKNTLEILDNYLERAVAENLNIVDVLDHIFAEEAKYFPDGWSCAGSGGFFRRNTLRGVSAWVHSRRRPAIRGKRTHCLLWISGPCQVYDRGRS